jgi:crotonobetainyl-CoA:carnitine CoA-transferase CaiB-like acyl-CoA transferase
MNTSLPLEGHLAIEFTHTVMGPAAGMSLADFGAEVIRIEPLDGDRTRRLKGSGLGYFGFITATRNLSPSISRALVRTRCSRDLFASPMS